MLEIKNLSFSYNKKDFIFKDLNLSLEKGLYVITGPNGSGKTTLVRIITRMAELLYQGKIEGRISLNGKENFKPYVVLQNNDASLFYETLVDEISFLSLNKDFIFKDPLEFFKRWNLEKIKDIRSDFLSYGQKQIYSIAVSLSFKDRDNLIIMDEPIAFLDELNIAYFRDLISELKKENVILLFGHRFLEISDIVDGFFNISGGKIEKIPKITYQRKKLISANHDRKDIILKISSLTHNFIKNKVDFEIKKFDMKVVYGINGSGKTTLAKILSGIVRDFKGYLYIEEKHADSRFLLENVYPVFANPDTQIISRRISNIFENFCEKANSILKKLCLLEKKDYFISHLSYGEKQKFLIAYAILKNKKIILVDEPFISFDYESEKAIFEILKDYIEEGGSVIFFTHRKDILDLVDCDIIEL
ncbi:MAG: ATP-binding cassette domain-containing protein [Elusimicrobiota bacterium]